jgi:hypothetical protein
MPAARRRARAAATMSDISPGGAASVGGVVGVRGVSVGRGASASRGVSVGRGGAGLRGVGGLFATGLSDLGLTAGGFAACGCGCGAGAADGAGVDVRAKGWRFSSTTSGIRLALPLGSTGLGNSVRNSSNSKACRSSEMPMPAAVRSWSRLTVGKGFMDKGRRVPALLRKRWTDRYCRSICAIHQRNESARGHVASRHRAAGPARVSRRRRLHAIPLPVRMGMALRRAPWNYRPGTRFEGAPCS